MAVCPLDPSRLRTGHLVELGVTFAVVRTKPPVSRRDRSGDSFKFVVKLDSVLLVSREGAKVSPNLVHNSISQDSTLPCF